MGFVRDVRKIVAALPKVRQSLLFSATMPGDVAKLAGEMLHNPVRIEVTPKVVTAERIEQRVYHVPAAGKRALLAKLLEAPDLSRVIVFTRTKHGANKVAKQLGQFGVEAEAIHGNKSQSARQRALARFRSGEARVLVATDIAARGIDVDDVSHVINFELPNEPESYVHRIGRTARAGAGGIALSFCDPSERAYLRDIEKLTKRKVPVANDDAAASVEMTAEAVEPAAQPKPKRRRRSRGKRPDQPNAERQSQPKTQPKADRSFPPQAEQPIRRRRRRAA
jgi:ATP-dependent RNA helicase RhlE